MNRVLVNSTGSVTWTRPKTGRNTTCRTPPTVPRNTSAPLAAITHNPPRRDETDDDQPEQPFARHRRIKRKRVAHQPTRHEQSARHQQRPDFSPTHPGPDHRRRTSQSPKLNAGAAQIARLYHLPRACRPLRRSTTEGASEVM